MQNSIKIVIDSLKKIDEIDKEIVYKLIDLLKLSNINEFLEYKDDIINILDKYISKNSQDNFAFIEYIRLYTSFYTDLPYIFISSINKWLEKIDKNVKEDVIYSFINILIEKKYLIKKINYISLYNFILNNLELYIFNDKVQDLFIYLFDNNLIKNEDYSLIINNFSLYKSTIIKYNKLRNLYIFLLKKNNNLLELYDFSLQCITGEYEESIEFYLFFVDLYKKVKELKKDIIDYNLALDVSNFMLRKFSNKKLFVFKIEILEDSMQIKEALIYLRTYILDNSFTDIEIINIYIRLFVKYLYLVSDEDINFIQKLLDYFKLKEIENTDIVLINIYLSYKSGKKEEFIDSLYNLIYSYNKVESSLIPIFVLFFNNIDNFEGIINKYNKIIYIIDKFLTLESDNDEDLINIKINLMIKNNQSLDALYNLLNFIKIKNFKINQKLTSLFLFLFRKHVNEVNFDVMNKLYNLEKKDLINFLFMNFLNIVNDVNFLKVYIDFMQNVNELDLLYDNIDSFLDNIDFNKNSYKELIYYYLDLSIKKLNLFLHSNSQQSSKFYTDNFYLKIYKKLNKYVYNNMFDGILLYKYCNFLLLCEKYNDAYTLLNVAVESNNVSNLSLIYNLLLKIAKIKKEDEEKIRMYATKLLDLDENNIDAYVELSKILYELNDDKSIEKADNLVKIAYSKDPHNVDVIILYCNFLVKNNKYDEAINIILNEVKINNSKNLEDLLIDIYNKKQEYIRKNKSIISNSGI